MKASQTYPSSRRVFLLGRLHAFNEGHLRRLSGEKAQSLLAYLVLHPHLPHPRQKLADLFYPEAPFERVRRKLTDTLYRLQKALGSDWFVVERESVALRLDEHLWVDVWEFERLAGSDLEAELEKAVDIYTGELLPELYDDWLLSERELLRNQYHAVLEKLAILQEGGGEVQRALLTWRRLIAAEPLHEPAHQAYLRLLGRMQRYGEALAHYEYFQTLLRCELDAEPLDETRGIVQAIEGERDKAIAQATVEENMPFIGRTTERAAVLGVLEAMFQGKGKVLAIEGEAGIGKSRLLREIAAGVRWRGATLLQGMASETPNTSPFSPLVDALSAFINSPRGAQVEMTLKGETLAALAQLNPEWKKKFVLDKVPPEAAVNRFYDALNIFGASIARLTPLVLAFDDLQWASPALWKSLDVLAQSLVGAGGMLIAIYRRPEIEQTPGWEFVQAWDRIGILKSISLGPFSVEEVSQLIKDAPQIDAVELHAQTGGNPFYIHEWLSAPESNKTSGDLPVANRLQKLSKTARLALESASVLGESIPYRLWTEISDLSSLALATLSDELVANRWLKPSAAGYAFEHDLLRSAVYGEIEPSKRRRLHQRAANAYTSLDPENLRARAFHLDQAGLAAEAARAYRLAGEQDFSRFALREAQAALDRALSLLPLEATGERIETAIALAKTCDATGDRARQKSALDEALANAKGDEPQRLSAHLEGARFNIHIGQVAEAEQLVESALALARRLGDHEQETEALLTYADLCMEQGKWGEVQKWSLQALQQAQSSSNQFAEGRALRYVGIVTRKMGNPVESIEWLERAIALQRALGDRLQVSISQTNLLPAFNELGAWDRLIATAQELVPIKDALGDRLGAAITRQNQSLAYYALGDYVTARQILERVVQDSEAVLSRRRMGLARNVLGLVAEGEGNYQEALQLYHTSLADAEAVKAATETAYVKHDLGALLVRLEEPSEAIPLLEAARSAWIDQGNLLLQVKSEAYLGLARLAVGDWKMAEELAERGWSTSRSGTPAGEQAQDWLWALYRLLAALGQPERAEAVLRAAYAELQRQGSAISDPDLRKRFFEYVPHNRTIVEAYDRLAGIRRGATAALARQDVPLGRSLRQDEFVNVQWTLSAPEDEAIPDKAERRQYRLKRLLKEAEEQGAAPTDDDLARALGVSRRTILRDMHELAQKIPLQSTRKRKA
jgi:DNA-binding SARP family transcriptional activator/tetratricopeptide (TPR) repeat protein